MSYHIYDIAVRERFLLSFVLQWFALHSNNIKQKKEENVLHFPKLATI